MNQEGLVTSNGTTQKDTYQVNREFLWGYRELREKIYNSEEQIRSVDQKLTKLKASNPSAEHVEYSFDKYKIDDLLSLKIDLENQLKSQLDEAKTLRRKILLSIDTVQNPQSALILHKYFLDGEELNSIAEDLHIAERTAQRRYNQGLRRMEQVDT